MAGKLLKTTTGGQMEDGIYYIKGGIFLMQLIVASHLSEEANLWLRNLTNDLKESNTAEKLVNMLLGQNKIEEIKKVTTDEKVREEYYTLYHI